jgi:hypothetical protein
LLSCRKSTEADSEMIVPAEVMKELIEQESVGSSRNLMREAANQDAPADKPLC